MQKANQFSNHYIGRLFLGSVCKFIRLYQLTLSPLMGPRCRFYPSCSQYAIESIQQQGVLRGLGATAVRLSKCHPAHPGGVDLPNQSPIASTNIARGKKAAVNTNRPAECCGTINPKTDQY